MGTYARKFSILAFLVLGSLVGLQSQDTYPSGQSSGQASPAPDNTKTNQRDRKGDEATADQQKENKSDRELARQVRHALVQDKALSTTAHNIKVIAQNGTVTLKGPVRSDEEKHAVEAKAAEVAGGAEKIQSEISVNHK